MTALCPPLKIVCVPQAVSQYESERTSEGDAEREDLGDWERLRFTVPLALAPYLAEKGSVAVDGISLTVTAVSSAGAAQHWFEVGLIPTTLAVTTLGARQPGSTVNLEVDVMAKYAARLAAFGEIAGGAPQTPGDAPGTDAGVRA